MNTEYIKSELQTYGVADDLIDSATPMVINMVKISGWEMDKCIAFAARKCGVDAGDIGPGWKKKV